MASMDKMKGLTLTGIPGPASFTYLSTAYDAGVMSGDASGVAMTTTGTMTSGTSIYGINLTVTPLGTGMSANAAYMKIAGGSTKHITGWNAVLELEYSCSGIQTPADTSCLQLNWSDNRTYTAGSSPITNSPYIMLREYSTAQFRNACFVRFYDVAPATTDPATLLTTLSDGYETHINVAVRCMHGTTPFWLYGSTDAAA